MEALGGATLAVTASLSTCSAKGFTYVGCFILLTLQNRDGSFVTGGPCIYCHFAMAPASSLAAVADRSSCTPPASARFLSRGGPFLLKARGEKRRWEPHWALRGHFDQMLATHDLLCVTVQISDLNNDVSESD